MSEEDDKAEVYNILSEPYYDEEEQEIVREEGGVWKYTEEGRWTPDFNPSMEPPPITSVDKVSEYQDRSDGMSLDFEIPNSWPGNQRVGRSPKISTDGGRPSKTHQRTIEELMQMVQKVLGKQIAIKSENNSLQARLKDVLSQLDEQLVRREADQKKICRLQIQMQQEKVKEPTPKIPESPLGCDVQMVDTFTALGNSSDNPTVDKACVDQLTRDPAKEGEPPTQQHLLGLWDPDVQIVSIGFELPEWVTIRLANAQNDGPPTKIGYLISLRVLEDITTNIKDLTGSLSVLEAAFANNEALLHEEKELCLESQLQVEELRDELEKRDEQVNELLNDLRKKQEQDDAILENARAEREFEEKRQSLIEELENSQRNLVEERKDMNYDPSNPTQEKFERKIQKRIEEVENLKNAIDNLESTREKVWLEFVGGLDGLDETELSNMVAQRESEVRRRQLDGWRRKDSLP